MNATTITVTIQSGLTDTRDRKVAHPASYEAPDHVTVEQFAGRSLGYVGKSDGTGTYEQFSKMVEFSGCCAGDVIRVYPWNTEHRVHKTKKGLVVREYPRIYPR